ncbi:superoxide dismutase [Cu-Zn] SodC [Neisseriaceae bacterium TC5R-5]|nr:superoxide dismutase [Cu-Zn] SodC [Neisseriaceae bacterium TC5R-5]
MLRLSLIPLFCLSSLVSAQIVEMNFLDASGITHSAGSISIEETPYGVLFTPRLTGLTPGIHGFHLHEHPSCGAALVKDVATAGAAAGGHWDPDKTGNHAGPYGNGHKGDLPALYIAADGTASYPVLAPRLTINDLNGHSLMIHAGGDNHSDHPAMLGGGGARVVCGVI